jgi:hypothetical protein
MMAKVRRRRTWGVSSDMACGTLHAPPSGKPVIIGVGLAHCPGAQLPDVTVHVAMSNEALLA